MSFKHCIHQICVGCLGPRGAARRALWLGSCAWSDDSLASKKLYPGHQFPAKTKVWLARLKVSDESMLLFGQRVHSSHDRKPDYLRKVKDDQAAMEALAERAAFIWHCGQEFLQHVPVKAADIRLFFYDAWVAGHSVLETEAQAALLDKSPAFEVTKHLSALRGLMDSHMFSAPIATLSEPDKEAWTLTPGSCRRSR